MGRLRRGGALLRDLGFALALPFTSGAYAGYGPFLVKRFFRLHIPYLAAVLMAIGLIHLVAPARIPELSTWFHRQWLQPVGNSQPPSVPAGEHGASLGHP